MASIFGIFLHAIGGFAAGSFYLPIKRVRDWAWESGWLVLGIAAWIIAPHLAAALTTPGYFDIISEAPQAAVGYAFLFGLLWGIGGLTFGLAMRYLGISLGMAVALGLTAAFGTLVPPIFDGTFGTLLTATSGQISLVGVALCLVGIAVCGYAGLQKDRALAAMPSTASADEFDLGKGVIVAVVSGLLSACFAFGLAAGEPIAAASEAAGTDALYRNNVVLVVILAGGFLTNAAYCVFLNARKSSYRDYADTHTPLQSNYLWAAAGGVTWYLQFFFYGMGATLLGEGLEFASWTIHMAFIIVFSTLWGLREGEWAQAGAAARRTLWTGLAIIIASTVVIGVAGAVGS